MRTLHTILLAVPAALLLAAGARADVRCGALLQNDPCLEQNPVCPPVDGPLGPANGSWPAYQQNPQHTGVTTQRGPTCSDLVWTQKLKGKVLGAMSLAEPSPGEPQTLFVPVAKQPVCGLDPATGAVLWCGTDNLGKLVDRSSPVVGNGNLLYVGTRDNDLWAVEVPPAGTSQGTVAWRQKVCTDGDVTMPPAIGPDGIVYAGSDSLGGGTIIAMCPGTSGQMKWCRNPVGGGVRNMSPAMSPAGDKVYFTIGKTTLAAYQAQTGEELWRIELERKRGRVHRTPNYSPVVNPVTGRVYVGLDSGLWAVDTTIDPETSQESPVASLLYDTLSVRERMTTPPALDLERNRIVFGAARSGRPSLYAIGLDGTLLWKRSDLPRGKLQNNPPVVDGDGRIYLALRKTLMGLAPTGSTLWQFTSRSPFVASPIIADDVLYVGSTNATLYAIGGCAP